MHGGEDQPLPLTREELVAIRRIILADDRARWFWTTVRNIATFVIAVASAAAALKIWVIDALRSLK
jgi:hypothetical protein